MYGNKCQMGEYISTKVWGEGQRNLHGFEGKKKKKEISMYFYDQLTVRKLDSLCYLRDFSIER